MNGNQVDPPQEKTTLKKPSLIRFKSPDPSQYPVGTSVHLTPKVCIQLFMVLPKQIYVIKSFHKIAGIIQTCINN